MARRKIWESPATDRTRADANYIASLADQIREHGIESLTEEQRLYWFFGGSQELWASDGPLGTKDGEQLVCRTKVIKGAINAYDYNRIERNCVILAERLNAYGYPVSIQARTDWVMGYFPHRLTEIDRIRDNVNTLLDAYHKMPGSPDIRYWGRLDWTDANSLEQNIRNIDTLLHQMITGFRYSGTFFSGQEVILP